MKATLQISGKYLLIMTVLLAAPLYASQAQTSTNRKVQTMPGDTVWVVVNHVKPDKREQFERFVYELFWPASAKLDEKAQQAFSHTRVLNPVSPEEDGTYTYVFLMDPLISGQDYWIDSILKKMYPANQAAEYYKLFTDALAREGKTYRMLQSKY